MMVEVELMADWSCCWADWSLAARDEARRNRVASLAVNTLVETTQISGPASRVTLVSARR